MPFRPIEVIHLPISILLGILAALILVLFALIKKLVTRAFTLISNPLVADAIGRALVGVNLRLRSAAHGKFRQQPAGG